jgi:hypothetical protein
MRIKNEGGEGRKRDVAGEELKSRGKKHEEFWRLKTSVTH